MPPRYAYWTILAGGLPTAFRSADRDELLPTFQRLREKHPDAQMKWFARGRLWDSPEQARQESERRRDPAARGERRTGDWRPGGTHRDPRQKFKDAKKARNIDRRHSRFERKHADVPVEKPHGDKVLPPPREPKHAPHPRSESRSQRPDFQNRNAGQRRDWQSREQRPDRGSREQRRDWHDRERPPREKPHGDQVLRPPPPSKHAPHQRPEARPPSGSRPPSGARPRGESRPRADSQNRHSGQRREWQNREQRPDRGNRDHDRDWRDRERPPREKPHGDPLTRPPRRENRAQTDRPAPPTKRSDTRSPGARPFRPRNPFERNQRPNEAATPPRPSGPNREPPPSEQSEPTPPPRPSEPAVLPPGPPERGRARDERHRRDRGHG